MSSRPWYIVVGAFLAGLALACVIGWFLYHVRSVLPPFIIAFTIAWLLDTLLDRLQARGCPRVLAVAGVYVVFLAVFVVGLVFLVPRVGKQAAELGQNFPDYAVRFNAAATEFMEAHRPELIKFELPITIQDAVSEYSQQITDTVKSGIQRIGSWLLLNLGKLLWVVLIPMAAFYFLNDIDRIRAKAVLFIPEGHRDRTVGVLSRMGTVFSNYVRGLVIVCLIYGIVTAIVLAMLQVKYGILLGLLAAILYAVPYIGAILTTLLVFVVGWATFMQGVSHPIWVPPLAMISLNQIFDLLITPKILGKSVGLHPILSLFALLAGGQLFGLVGMILAVPLAASIQEIVFEFYPQMRGVQESEKPKRSLLDRLRKPRQPLEQPEPRPKRGEGPTDKETPAK